MQEWVERGCVEFELKGRHAVVEACLPSFVCVQGRRD